MTHSHLLLPVVVFLGMQLAEEYALTLTRSRGWNEKNNWKKVSHIEGKANTRTGVHEKDCSRAKWEYRKCKDSPQESVMSVLEEGLLFFPSHGSLPVLPHLAKLVLNLQGCACRGGRS